MYSGRLLFSGSMSKPRAVSLYSSGRVGSFRSNFRPVGRLSEAFDTTATFGSHQSANKVKSEQGSSQETVLGCPIGFRIFSGSQGDIVWLVFVSFIAFLNGQICELNSLRCRESAERSCRNPVNSCTDAENSLSS